MEANKMRTLIVENDEIKKAELLETAKKYFQTVETVSLEKAVDYIPDFMPDITLMRERDWNSDFKFLGDATANYRHPGFVFIREDGKNINYPKYDFSLGTIDSDELDITLKDLLEIPKDFREYVCRKSGLRGEDISAQWEIVIPARHDDSISHKQTQTIEKGYAANVIERHGDKFGSNFDEIWESISEHKKNCVPCSYVDQDFFQHYDRQQMSKMNQVLRNLQVRGF